MLPEPALSPCSLLETGLTSQTTDSTRLQRWKLAQTPVCFCFLGLGFSFFSFFVCGFGGLCFFEGYGRRFLFGF